MRAFVDRLVFRTTPGLLIVLRIANPNVEIVNTRSFGACADRGDGPIFAPGFERDEVQWNLLWRNDVVFDLDYGGRFNWCDHADELQEF